MHTYIVIRQTGIFHFCYTFFDRSQLVSASGEMFFLKKKKKKKFVEMFYS